LRDEFRIAKQRTIALNPTFLRIVSWVAALAFVLIAVWALFFASFDQLTANGRRNGGYTFLGLTAVFGEAGARYILALSSLFVAALLVGFIGRRKN
jgi:hypothetical protein